MNRLLLLKNQLSASSNLTFTKLTTESVENGTIGVVTLNAQKELNALSKIMSQELLLAFSTFSEDPKIKVIILKSAIKKAFCAGANIKELSSITVESQSQNDYFETVERAFNSCKKPIIALVNGIAVGGGFEIALSSDIILMSEEARFGLPEINLGVIPCIGGT